MNDFLDPEYINWTPEKVDQENQKSATSPAESADSTISPTSSVAREYQLEIYKKAVSENIIAVLDTGAGKTLISILLIKHVLSLENEKCQTVPKYKKKITFFLVDKVPLVFQQESVIRANIDARIEKLCGQMNVDNWNIDKWRSILDNVDICVLTAQIFLDLLQRAFLSMEEVNLLVFDECHHAVKGHPFNLIMLYFYLSIKEGQHKPKIFGMTASPIISNKPESISVLEVNLDSKVYTAINITELDQVVKKPNETKIVYSMKVINDIPEAPTLNKKKSAAYHEAWKQGAPLVELRFPRSNLTTLIASKLSHIAGYKECVYAVDYIANNLGPWCGDRIWKVMLCRAHKYGLPESTNGAYVHHSTNRLSVKDTQSLSDAYCLCDRPVLNPNTDNVYLFTPKVQALIRCLREIISATDYFHGIIFVERRYTAAAIKLLLDAMTEFSHFKSEILIGHGGTNNTRNAVGMNFKGQNNIITRFRKGELNLLIATNVAEEGLDIQACNYVIRFDMFKTLIAYIQSRGRARRPDSKYIMLINLQNPKEYNLLEQYKQTEVKMKEFCRLLPEERNVASYFSIQQITDPDSMKKEMRAKYLHNAYEIPETKALLTLTNAISLVYHYCAALPSDEFCSFRPIYKIRKNFVGGLDTPMYECTLILPVNSNLRTFFATDVSKDDVKMNVSLKACIALYESGDIDNNLVPANKKRKIQIAQEQDRDAGKQIGSRGRENLYMKGMPSLWCTNSEYSNNGKLALGPYWVSYIRITTDSAESYRKLCLITKQPLPDIPTIKLFQDNISIKIEIDNSTKTEIRFETEEQVHILLNYMFALTKCITNKEFNSIPTDKVAYLIAPLRRGNRNSFDWKEMKRSIGNDNKTPLTSIDGMKDTIIIDSQRLYIVDKSNFLSSTEHLTLQSQVPAVAGLRESGYETFAEYYQAQKDISIKDMNQPLIRVHRIYKNNVIGMKEEANSDNPKEDVKVQWLVPEICHLYCNSASVFQSLHLLPAITSRIDSMLLAQEAKQSLKLLSITDDIMMEALTTSSANLPTSYQRLEFLGDSVLKFVTTTRVFTHFPPTCNESELTVARMSMISNAKLYRSAEKLGLFKYICDQAFVPRKLWRPPHFTSPADTEGVQEKLQYHKLADKTLADVIESILGAVYFSNPNDLDCLLSAARQLGVDLDQVQTWSQFNNSFLTQYKHSTAFVPFEMRRVIDIIGHVFKNPSLVCEAMTHASVLESSFPCYQRLEFLGDTVLEFCVTKYLFEKYGDAQPGSLHELRKSSVNNGILSVLCVELGLHTHIRHNSDTLVKAMEHFCQQLNQAKENNTNIGEYWLEFGAPKVLADVIESLIGAVYVDCGFQLDPVMSLFDRWLKPMLEKHISLELIKEHPMEKFSKAIQGVGCLQYEFKNVTTSNNTIYSADDAQKCIVFIHRKAFASGTGFNVKLARKQAASNASFRLQYDDNCLSSLCDCRATTNRSQSNSSVDDI